MTRQNEPLPGERARRVDEGEYLGELDFLEQSHRVFEFRIGLARKADDDVGAQRDIRNVLPQLLDSRHITGAVVAAVHPFQDTV